MTARAERRREYFNAQRRAILAAITPRQDQQQLQQRAKTLAAHGNTDQAIAIELEVTPDDVRRWIASPAP